MFRLYIILCTSVCIGLSSCTPPPARDLSAISIIPQPVEVVVDSSSFALRSHTEIFADKELEQLGLTLIRELTSATAQTFVLKIGDTAEAHEGISLQRVPHLSEQLGQEGYQLDITEDYIKLKAPAKEGLFRGMQTLRQIVPVHADDSEHGIRYLATGTIVDRPIYAYRGMMLDVARHFFAVKDVKRLIDHLALYKINHLHLHLADDQGWRVEIKSWPKLTEIGGSTQVGGGKGGYYTQAEYQELVQYANDHFITIVPEIDMPGHTNAALAAYPELNCDGKARELYTGTRVGFSTLCTDKAITYRFIDDVVRELSELTPGSYIHIGGDESDVTPLDAYIPFIDKVEDIVNKYGKQMIGWDEIAQADLRSNSVVQFWRHDDFAQKGVAKGAKILLSPAHKTYLDMQYDSTTELGLHWAAYIELDSAYQWSPESIVAELEATSILGIESPLWSETVTTLDEIEYMAFPRILGHAELGWSPHSVRNWESYRRRLAQQAPRMELLGINYYASPLIDWPNGD